MERALRFALITLAGTASCLSAQWTGGLKGGLGQGGFTGNSEFSWSATAPSFVIFASRPVNERVLLQPELSATQKVGHSTVGGSSLTYTGDDVNLQALVRLNYSPRGPVTPFLVAGPGMTLHAGCSLQLVISGLVTDFGCEQRSLLSRLDPGVVAGAGVSQTIGSTVVSIESRVSANARSVAVPDGSGYGRSIAWSILVGASTPVHRPSFLRRRAPEASVATTPPPADSSSW